MLLPIQCCASLGEFIVAITRARYQVKILASFHPSLIDRARTSSRGVHLLRAYMEFAEQGPIALAADTTVTGGEAESPFEEAVASALRARGLRVVHQVGVGGFRIDLGIQDEQHDVFLLGVECDGATYHSSRTARDRDRLRQEVLENLGWRIHRIWSTDWIKNPGREVEKVLAALEEARSRPSVPPPPLPRPVPAEPVQPDMPPTVMPPPLVDWKLGLAVPYREAVLPDGEPDELQMAGIEALVGHVTAVVETESPVHAERVMRLVAKAHGRERLGKLIREVLERAVAIAVVRGQVRSLGEILWARTMTDPIFRTVEPVRAIGEVAPEELAAGVVAYLEKQFSMPREDLMAAIAREMGFGRMGAALQTAIGASLELLEATGRVTVNGNLVSLRR